MAATTAGPGTVPRVSVLGAGAFGTAIAAAVAASAIPVTLYCRTAAQADEIGATRENRRFFPGHPIASPIAATNDLDRALDAEMLFLAFPAGKLDDYAARLAALPTPPQVIVNLIKGLHTEFFTFSELFRTALPTVPYVALKGPTFARPIFLGELSGMTCGTADAGARAAVAAVLGRSNIDLDHCASPRAVDMLSAIKNVYAVALGIASSLGLAENTVFMLVSRIVREVAFILERLGEDRGALFTYSGLADMLLTGLCDTSRNRTWGMMLGRGLFIDTERSGFLTEGVRAFAILRAQFDDPLPILDGVVRILNHEVEPIAILETLGQAHPEPLTA